MTLVMIFTTVSFHGNIRELDYGFTCAGQQYNTYMYASIKGIVSRYKW
jgi:hypothetical protein